LGNLLKSVTSYNSSLIKEQELQNDENKKILLNELFKKNKEEKNKNN
jgi:hypothetical protein